MAPIRIDGSTLEGGGQVLRVSTACAVTLGKALTVYKIRAGRSKPGLKAQHLKGLELVASMCGGRLEGGAMDSQEVTLHPSRIKPGHYHADTQTAGSVTLLLQAAFPCALFAKGLTHFTLVGGTNADMAPPCDYTANVFRPMAAKFGAQFTMDVVRRGFYPQGGGELRVEVTPLTQPLTAVTLLKRGNIPSIEGICYVTGLPPRLANMAVDCAIMKLRKCPELKEVPINIKKDVSPKSKQNEKALGMVLWCTTDEGTTLGASFQGKMHLGRERSSQPDEVGYSAADKLVKVIAENVCVDSEMQNQLIILMGLAEGRSKILCGELTLHTHTAIEIMHQATQAKFSFFNQSNGRVVIECEGVGLNPDTLPCTT